MGNYSLMSKFSNFIAISLFIVCTVAALFVVTDAWQGPWVASASDSDSAYTFEHYPDLSSVALAKEEVYGDAEMTSPYPYPVPIPVRVVRSGDDVSLLAQLLDLLLTMSLSADDIDQGLEIFLYQLDDLDSDEKSRVIGSAFRTEILDQDGNPVTELDEPIMITLTYDDNGMIDGDEEALQLYIWSQSLRKWIPIEASINVEQNRITARIQVGGDGVSAASGQAIQLSDSGSLELALMGRSHLYLPLIEGASAQAAQ